MVRRLLITLVITLLVGLSLVYVGVRVLRQKQAENDAALNQKKEDIQVTIIEGKRREEVAALMAEKGITSYEAFLAATTEQEGYLFPETYRFFPDTPAPEVAAKLIATYENQIGSQEPTAEQLIVASIVEREARNDAERAIIAGVYQNRLNIEMKLDADPTVQYGKDSLAYAAFSPRNEFIFWGPILRADYQNVQSPYNTYRSAGLPPGPICSPGLASIRAAQNPASHPYYYFAHRGGELLLSRTLTEHNTKLQAAD